RFVHVGNKKPYIKCDHVITLGDLSKLHTAVGLYDGALTVFQDSEPLVRSEITVRPKGLPDGRK
ncbi:hypothetical protein, partial [Herbiconiux daphne]